MQYNFYNNLLYSEEAIYIITDRNILGIFTTDLDKIRLVELVLIKNPANINKKCKIWFGVIILPCHKLKKMLFSNLQLSMNPVVRINKCSSYKVVKTKQFKDTEDWKLVASFLYFKKLCQRPLSVPFTWLTITQYIPLA